MGNLLLQLSVTLTNGLICKSYRHIMLRLAVSLTGHVTIRKLMSVTETYDSC